MKRKFPAHGIRQVRDIHGNVIGMQKFSPLLLRFSPKQRKFLKRRARKLMVSESDIVRKLVEDDVEKFSIKK